jgi:hypothetical protein
LWVLDTNERALRFYHRHGSTEDPAASSSTNDDSTAI